MATKTLQNALGELLSYTSDPNAWFSATRSGPQLFGSAGNDAMYGDSAVNVTMIGGTGNDTYYLYSAINRAQESPGGGIDTINTWMSYTLPDNFENLVVTGNDRYAYGNSVNNIITGGSGHQTINGFGGNDILIGGGGADTFVFQKGNGTDLITDFGADDTIRLQNYGYTSFAEVKSHMTQAGANVGLDLGGGEAIVFSNATIDKFSAGQFQLALDRTQLTQTFGDEFNSLSLRSGTAGTWNTGYSYFGQNGGTLSTNGESQWYINPSYAPTASANPFSVQNGVLTITAETADASIKPLINNYGYTSGMLTTASSFSQTYGYFEMRADMPEDRGAWPAFWLLPANGKWPPEIDVVEMRGQESGIVHVTAHTMETGTKTDIGSSISTDTKGFHTYGVLWTASTITWYVDDVSVYQVATPADMHQPMFLVVNLAVGGAAGPPSAADFADGAHMQIDYLHAYALNSSAAAHAAAHSASDTLL